MPKYRKSKENLGLACPECKSLLNKVIDSTLGVNRITRRRKCINNHRFTSIEIIAEKDSNYIKTPSYNAPQGSSIDYTQLAKTLHNLK